MTTNPTVSVNLCCYNGERYLREALDSIVNQTYTDWELVIINDGSTDSTESIIREYIDRGYPIVYHYQENHGLGYSRNRALELSRGEFIAFIDQDDMWLPEKLERQIPLFQRDLEVGIVISNVIEFNDAGRNNLVYRSHKPKTGYVFREVFSSNFIYLSSAVMRRKVLDTLNEWFDERFRYVEDGELFARICYKWKLDYVNQPLTKRRVHKNMSMVLRPELSPKETEMMIDKFIKIFPDFDKKFKNELILMRFYAQYHYALIDWREGKNRRVRERLRPFLFWKFKAIIPYLLSLVSFTSYSHLLRCYRKYIKRIPIA